MSAERPLAGRRILNTRAFEQSGSLDAGLRALGAEPAGVPSIFFESPDDLGPLHEAARSIDEAAWVVFTSGTGVEQGWGAIREAWPDGLPAGVGVAAIGSGTASALAEVGAPVDFLPPEASGDALVATLPVRPGDRVAIAMRNLPEWPVVFFAAQALANASGAIAAATCPLMCWAAACWYCCSRSIQRRAGGTSAWLYGRSPAGLNCGIGAAGAAPGSIIVDCTTSALPSSRAVIAVTPGLAMDHS